MVNQEQKDARIREFVANYHTKKAISGEGLESKYHWWMNPYFMLLLMFLLFGGLAVSIFTGIGLLALIPGFTLGVAMFVHFDPILFFKPLFAWGKEMERMRTWELRLASARRATEDQIDEIEQSPLTEDERQVLFELAFLGPIHGKESVKRVLPEILDKYEGLRMLSFMQELARDLKIRR